MNWFDGPIINAINESKKKNLIFLVYNRDSNSREMDDLWNDSKISNLCKENCVSLCLEAESESCNQFRQLYPITVFPTTYFIGINGVPIEIVAGVVSKEILEEKLANVIKIYKTAKPESVSSSASSADTKSDSCNNMNEEERKKKLDEKVSLAKEKLRQIQEKKKQDEEEKEKQLEIERRKMGQEILKSKKEREEQELKRIAEQKRQEKIEDQLAKQRIKEKIQQDREDKQKKYSQEKEEMIKIKENAAKQQELLKQQQETSEALARSHIARIQFRLINGSSIVKQFDSDQTLDDARKFISDKLRDMNETSSFSMHSTFPKRDFTEIDMAQTLRTLQLFPSASILIMPIRSTASKALSNLMPKISSVSSSGSNESNSIVGYVNDFLGFLFLPFTIIWGLIGGIFGIRSNRSNSGSSNNLNRPISENQPPINDNIRIRNTRRNFGSLGSSRNDNDDDNATWNGNSTQQM